jgi:hypothetical protein
MGRPGTPHGDGPIGLATALLPHRVLVLVVAATFGLAATACDSTEQLRHDQSVELRQYCQSVASRVGWPSARVEEIPRWDLQRFRLDLDDGPRRGVDIIAQCR